MRDPIRDCPHGSMKGKCDSCELVEAGARIAELEAAIRKHRNNIWGEGEPVSHPEDDGLYAVLQHHPNA